MSLLEIDNLVTTAESEDRHFKVVDGLSLSLREGESLGLVGESGCGKSMTALSVMRLLPKPSVKIASGSIRFDDRELTGLSTQAMAKMRGEQIAMIFQDPMTALNPVQRIGVQIGEMLTLHEPGMELGEKRQLKVLALLRSVGLPAPEQRILAYPHQLSGGMRQRVMIAMALACKPRLLIADEPTTALDVTIQAQIVELIKTLQQQHNMGMLFITHDLGLVAQVCQRVAVMYAGRIVETGPIESLFRQPRHPYTRALLAALPGAGHPRKSRLQALEGQVPPLYAMPSGCRFANRCPHVLPVCRQQDPPVDSYSEHSSVACLRWREITL